MVYDNCPNGDTSPSYYDRSCGAASSQSISTSGSTISSVQGSGLFATNPIVASFDFASNKKIPQKVAAELNFFLSKITKTLDAKAGKSQIKKKQYYQALNVYLANLASQTFDAREKRIMGYLSDRLVVVSKGLLPKKSTNSSVATSSHK